MRTSIEEVIESSFRHRRAAAAAAATAVAASASSALFLKHNKSSNSLNSTNNFTHSNSSNNNNINSKHLSRTSTEIHQLLLVRATNSRSRQPITITSLLNNGNERFRIPRRNNYTSSSKDIVATDQSTSRSYP